MLSSDSVVKHYGARPPTAATGLVHQTRADYKLLLLHTEGDLKRCPVLRRSWCNSQGPIRPARVEEPLNATCGSESTVPLDALLIMLLTTNEG